MVMLFYVHKNNIRIVMKKVSFDEFMEEIGGHPNGAAFYVKEYLERHSISLEEASKTMSIPISNLECFLGGGDFTSSMASSLEHTYGMDSKLLFRVESMMLYHQKAWG